MIEPCLDQARRHATRRHKPAEQHVRVEDDPRPSAYLVYLALCAEHTAGRAALSHGEMAERTGLSKRAVQDALRHLAGRALIAIERRDPTEAAIVTPLAPWRRDALRK